MIDMVLLIKLPRIIYVLHLIMLASYMYSIQIELSYNNDVTCNYDMGLRVNFVCVCVQRLGFSCTPFIC